MAPARRARGAGDRSVFATALREAQEETGLAALEDRLGGRVLDVDVHPIPARRGRPAHVHYDIRYLLTASGDAVAPQKAEVYGAVWFTLEEAFAAGVDHSLARAPRRANALLQNAASRV
ncbi:MAG: NUDIX domain-containing protein [Thermoanaerobaculia bacterium]